MNYFDLYRGSVSYLVLDPNSVEKLVMSCDDIMVFAFGDNVNYYLRHVSPVISPRNIEHMSLIFKMIMNAGKAFNSNILIDDAYEMQSLEGTAMGKGAAIKGFLSSFKSDIKSLSASMIFVSETIDYTMARHVRNLNLKIKK